MAVIDNDYDQSPRILIVEDEPFIAENLQEMLGIFGYENTEIANSANQAIKAIKTSRPELVLLDVKIKGDQDGIELGGIIHDQYKVPFVYITSYSDKETVNRAKHTQPLGFIVKPFTKDDVYAAIEVALFNKNRIAVNSGFNLFETNPTTYNNDSIFIKRKTLLEKVKYSDLIWIEADGNHITLHASENRDFTVRKSLKEITDKLPKDRFLRVHKSFVVQVDAVTAIDTNHVHLGEMKIPIGRSYYNAFTATLNTISAS
ncbi:MAG: two-component system response regulator [Cytophagales bacterium CG12_big_fil_rev_8_21_14_0_65_40_12]|jgi:DNA-binding LytR/AlgR family response regulator|uniref:response regulator n=4 Tax=Roseivirga sp. TaxID=1964215 RepID=UPI000C5C19BE|nr:MAG: two-component system response regulator [Cytophagales bacterium CG12_big_fil_rev_8_21_14_0_65_40_12]PIW05767.1 MAG: DNA-binding response regulator [Cytophagales bacterium CG17_big_fil_post_rev_8_21_14_2_50_40_13]